MSGKRSQEQRRELRKFYAERYKRIKDERKLLLNLLIGLSGGTIVLSVTLLEKIAPKKHLLGLLIAAWCLLGLAILVSIIGLMWMIWISQKFQRELSHMLGDEERDRIEMDFPSVSPHRMSDLTFSTEYLSGCFFILGILLLAAFAIINVISR